MGEKNTWNRRSKGVRRISGLTELDFAARQGWAYVVSKRAAAAAVAKAVVGLVARWRWRRQRQRRAWRSPMDAAAAAAARGGGVGSSSAAERGPKVELVSAAEAEEDLEEGRSGRARGDRMYASGCGDGGGESLAMAGKKRGRGERAAGCVTTAKERISRMPPCAAGKRSSIYRGVTRHRWTGRYEAHLWDKSTWNQNQNKKGKQGAYDDEEAAARAYDLAALKYWGAGTLINFPVSDYSRDLEEMQLVSKEDYLPQNCQWETPVGQMLGTTRDEEIKRKYAGGFCMERKTDLTRYIKWWVPNKTHHQDSGDKSYEEAAAFSDDASKELRTLESTMQPTEPYQLPSLGTSNRTKVHASSVSACDILSQSETFKNLQQKFLEKQDGSCSKEIADGRHVSVLCHGDGTDRSGTAVGLCDVPRQRVAFSGAPLPDELSRTSCNPIDPLPDPLLWGGVVPPSGLPVTATVNDNS
ncbi:hypothetical protein Taro_007177 [Colocasia esculenta]|uniref:AP2/ERF domain-containing protein n=1 Tax=Colocasia esculenta TaxID=4460 RepID=A0A843TTD3_COLES|nr:hypothetical protein [Colocasia esculenta]